MFWSPVVILNYIKDLVGRIDFVTLPCLLASYFYYSLFTSSASLQSIDAVDFNSALAKRRLVFS